MTSIWISINHPAGDGGWETETDLETGTHTSGTRLRLKECDYIIQINRGVRDRRRYESIGHVPLAIMFGNDTTATAIVAVAMGEENRK